MPSFKRPCRYCQKLVLPEDSTCPYCGKESPLYMRCPNCQAEISHDYSRCPSCGQALEIFCPSCGGKTFFDVYCEQCKQKIVVECPKCHTKQAPVREKCISCHKDLPYIARAVT